jgi:Arc/MetJ family transcription regulator
VTIPSEIRAGDTVKWVHDPTVDALGQPITYATHSLTYYLRTDANHEGAVVAGVTIGGGEDSGGWSFTLDAATTIGFPAQDWYWQALATDRSDASKTTIGAGQLLVLASLAYTGDPSRFDGRTQLEIDLDAVQAAIRALITGGAVKQYSIAGRSLTKYELKDLLALESQLKAQVKREQAAQLQANGLGNPHNLFVRF